MIIKPVIFIADKLKPYTFFYEFLDVVTRKNDGDFRHLKGIFEFEKTEIIKKDDLPYCFREFREYLGECKFTSCAHVNDKGCKICEAVEKGKISRIRHENYISLYNQAKEIKEWEL